VIFALNRAFVFRVFVSCRTEKILV